MPKMKTHRGMAKRVKISGSGRLLRSQAGRGHNQLAKGNDRVWATPLGALLGSQMGCNAVQGNAPLPW